MNSCYLARSGQTYGPFNEEQIQSMRKSGEFENYTWFWDGKGSDWHAIDPPPPAPTQKESLKEKTEAKTQAWTGRLQPDIQAICHNFRNIMSGSLARVTENGCEFISPHATHPGFGTRNEVLLNLLDTRTGRSMNVSATIRRVSRAQGSWIYLIDWEKCPELMGEV